MLLVAAAWVLPSPADGEEVEARLQTLRQRRSQVKSLHTVTETIIQQKQRVQRTRFEYWERKKDKAWQSRRTGRTESRARDAKETSVSESLTVSDGKYQWSELANGGAGTRIVIKGEANYEDEFGPLLANVKRGKARAKPGEKVQNLDTVVIDVVSGDRASPFKATYWISEKYGIILRTRMRHADGSSFEMMTKLCEVDTAVPAEKFDYTVPEGAKVIDTTNMGRGDSAKARP